VKRDELTPEIEKHSQNQRDLETKIHGRKRNKGGLEENKKGTIGLAGGERAGGLPLRGN